MFLFSIPCIFFLHDIFRVLAAGMGITRNPGSVARYTMIRHKSDSRNPHNVNRWGLIFLVLSLCITNINSKFIEPRISYTRWIYYNKACYSLWIAMEWDGTEWNKVLLMKGGTVPKTYKALFNSVHQHIDCCSKFYLTLWLLGLSYLNVLLGVGRFWTPAF